MFFFLKIFLNFFLKKNNDLRVVRRLDNKVTLCTLEFLSAGPKQYIFLTAERFLNRFVNLLYILKFIIPNVTNFFNNQRTTIKPWKNHIFI